MNFETKEQQLLSTFFQKHLKLVFGKHGYGVYQLEIDKESFS